MAIIGGGQIGSRHLQALAKLNVPVVIQVVDPNPLSLTSSRERFDQIPANENVREVEFLTDIAALGPAQDVCIIATSADVRLSVLRSVVDVSRVANMVLEKVAFQSARQFVEAQSILEQHTIACWVNCPLRTYTIYRQLKERLTQGESVMLTVSGGDWGLACNAIHYLDLMAFLTNDVDYELDASGLDSAGQPSKRAGFMEVTGKLIAHFSRGSIVELESVAGSQQQRVIRVRTDGFEMTLEEGTGQVYWSETDEVRAPGEFSAPYQSDLTQAVVKDILATGSCQLTPFAESMRLHTPLLATLTHHLNRADQRAETLCPIT